MAGSWLESKFGEIDSKVLKSQFALLGTIHWMRSLAILCDSQRFKDEMKNRYANVITKKDADLDNQMYTLSQILMAIHFLAALKEMTTSKDAQIAAALIRSAIISWYYGIYHSAKAMLAIQDGSRFEKHHSVADSWDRQLGQSSLVVFPFNYRISTLVDKSIKSEIDALDHANQYNTRLPNDEASAEACCCAYLKGTANWYREKEERNIKKRSDFKKQFKDFHPIAARKFRDDILNKHVCCFLHEAIRYRGKANYRDILFLSYGVADQRFIRFINDLEKVLFSFLEMTVICCSKRMDKAIWSEFIEDIEKNSHLSRYIEKIIKFDEKS